MRSLASLALSIPLAACYCPPPGPILPPPEVPESDFSSSPFAITSSAFTGFSWFNQTSFAIRASIGDATVFSYESTAEGYDFAQPLYETKSRLASVTKLFTVLALLLSDDKIRFDDPITKFIPELNADVYGEVTIGALAGHTSGLGRFAYVGDLAVVPGFNPAQLGLPAVNNTLPGCDPFPGGRVCTRQEVLDMFNNPAYRPYSPNSGPQYSNIGYNLLGMALEAVHSKTFEQVIEDLVFSPLGMADTSFDTPSNDGSAILPKSASSGWFVSDFANYNPTGGAWSTTDDLLKFLHALQHHEQLSAAETRKWLQPRALLPSLQQLVGQPWEILRPVSLNITYPRPIDVFLKAGGVTGYAAHALLVPEYDIAIAFNAAGNTAGAAVMDILPKVIEPLIAYADAQARAQARPKYAGKYVSSSNSTNSVTFAVDDGPGIAITDMNINGVPVLRTMAAVNGVSFDNFSARLYPTDPDSIGTNKESWKITWDQKQRDNGFAEMRCASWQVGDVYRYVREPLDTVVFEINESGEVVSAELLGWRAKLAKQS